MKITSLPLVLGLVVACAVPLAALQLPYPPGPPVLPLPATVTIEATVPDAYATGGVKGFFTVRRVAGDETVGNAAEMTVYYQVGGTALGGSQYRALSGFVTLPAGQAAALVKIKPLNDGAVGGQASVKLTLLSGDGYEVGVPAQAKVKVHEAPATR